jgi:hypothetical protein
MVGEQAPPAARAPRMTDSTTTGRRADFFLILFTALVAGMLLGTFEIANTSVGWHLASGRWILEHRAFIHTDPFSFTSGHAPWLDHEWFFQVVAAVAHHLGGEPALVVLRALGIGTLAVLLLVVGVRSGLSSPIALLLSIACVVGARPRFFLRPELVTLLVVPTACWLYLSREQRRSWVWLAWLALVMVIGANSHGGALVVPFLMGGMLAAETVQMVVRRRWRAGVFISGGAAVAASALALLVNPYGWRLYEVPFKLAHLVDQPHIPNPEWARATFAQTPWLFIALAAAVVIMGARGRDPVRWVLLAMAAALAFRHVRNLGLFFVLLPLAVAPALASWRSLTNAMAADLKSGKRFTGLAVAAALTLAVAVAASPWPVFGFAFADGYYPTSACDFLDREGLPQSQLYNDVRFGGYLINRYAPSRLVFQDDRNEIHDTLLREIWNIFQTTDVRAWNGLLERYGCDTALVRYHPPLQVAPPDGEGVTLRGFSARWFPSSEWALVYWDDVAMVFVRRRDASAALLERLEYHVVRPDDLEQLQWQLSRDPTLRLSAATETKRALRANPASWRALGIMRLIEHEVSTARSDTN